MRILGHAELERLQRGAHALFGGYPVRASEIVGAETADELLEALRHLSHDGVAVHHRVSLQRYIRQVRTIIEAHGQAE